MGVISARRARMDGVSTFRKASINTLASLQELRHAGTRGGVQRIKGVEDWNGTWEEFGLVPTFFPGAEITFNGSVDGTKGLKGNALVTEVTITIPVGTKGAPSISGSFRGIAALDKSDTTEVALPSAAAVPSVEGLCLELATLSASPSYVAQSGTNEITIVLSIGDLPYHDCGSSGYMEALEGFWDAKVTYKRRCLPSELPAEGTPYHVRIPIDNPMTEFYLFEYMRVGDLSDILLDRETGELLNVTIPLEMSIVETIGGTITTGTGVTKPDASVWRPNET